MATFAPQIKTFNITRDGTSDDAATQANEFAVKERFKNPTCPMPLLKQNGDGSVTVVYFIEVTPPAAPEEKTFPQRTTVESVIYSSGQNARKSWWPQRLKDSQPPPSASNITP